MRLTSRIVTCLALLGMISACNAYAQVAEENQILLDEPIAEPPARIVKEDTVKVQYENGKPRIESQVAFLSDELVVNHGKYTEFYHDGQKYTEGNFQRGVHTGAWEYWHPNGQLCKKITFNDGRPDGKWDVFRVDGTRESTKNYQNGLRHGEWTRYFPDGEKPKVTMNYNEGKNDGDRFTYFENGQKRQHLIFKNGLMDGTMTNWNEAGEKISEMTFEKGKISGKAVQFQGTEGVN